MSAQPFILNEFILTASLRSSAPLLPNIVPHLQTLVNFVTHTLPKPVLIALLYRLSILRFASYILPTIGADSWESEEGVDGGWDGRPVRVPVSWSFAVVLCFNPRRRY